MRSSQQSMVAASGPRALKTRGMFVGAVTLVVAACAATGPSPPLPAASIATGASPAPTLAAATEASPTAPPPTAAPYIPGPAIVPFGDPIVVDRLVTSATTAGHGIRVSVRADFGRFASADGLWVTTTLENVGGNMLRWTTDGCGIHVGLSARTGVDWAYGAEQPEPFKTYKDWVLDRYSNWEPYPIHLETTPEWGVDKGEFGCADLAVGHELEPGGRIAARHFVRAVTGRGGKYGLPPAGPVLLTGSFDGWRRGKEDPDTVRHEPLFVHLAVELVDGRDPMLLSPGQAIDVALGNDMVQDLLRRWDGIARFSPTSLAFEPGTEEWHVGLTWAGNTSEARSVLVAIDARAARVLGVRENP
jgi:hypothetical protein